MKYIYLLLVLILFSCNAGFTGIEDRDKKAVEWINQHPKPILTKYSIANGLAGTRKYTFVDRDGMIFNAGYVSLTLPDTIKQKEVG